MAWDVQMGDELAVLNLGGASSGHFCPEHGIPCDLTMLSGASICDDACRYLWSETVEHMLYNAFALEPLPAWFPVGEGALENATGMESAVVKRPGGGKKPQVRNVRMETRCLHISSLLTAHIAHARVVPTCQRSLRTL